MRKTEPKNMSRGELIAEVNALREDLARAEDELEGWHMRGPDEDDEIKLLREFIEDVQLGVRDLSEYRDACRPVII